MKYFAGCLILVAWSLTLVGCHGRGICMNTNARVTTVPAAAGPVMPMAVECQPASGGWRIALVDVDGLLLNTDMTGPMSQGDNPVSVFRERLTAVACDPCVRAVVVRINSPGGGVTASDIMWHELQRFRSQSQRPVVACLMDTGAGGAYLLATASDHIVAHPTTVIGGIGVILNIYNLSDAMAQYNITPTPVKSGENIDLGTPIKMMEPEKRKLLQDMADEYHTRFRDTVINTRHLTPDAQQTVFDGRVFTGQQAFKLGLVDSVGYLDDAIAMARQMGGVPQASVVVYHRATDRAHSTYSITPNIPLQAGLFPLSIPGLDRAKLPTFLYLWQPEPTLEKLSGH